MDTAIFLKHFYRVEIYAEKILELATEDEGRDIFPVLVTDAFLVPRTLPDT